MNLLPHLTLASGDVATHRLDLVEPAAVAACRGLFPHGGPVPAYPAFRVEIVAPVFTLFRGSEPLLTGGVARAGDEAAAAELWRTLCEVQSRFFPVRARAPGRAPWLAVVIYPSLALTAESDLGWMADFERSLAAAILKNET